MSTLVPVETEKLTITDAQNSNRPVMRLTSSNQLGVIQYLSPNGNVAAQLNQDDLQRLLQLLRGFPGTIVKLENEIAQLKTQNVQLRGQISELERFNSSNFKDDGTRLTINKRIIPMDGFQAANDAGVAIHDDDPQEGGRLILVNYGADSSITSKNNNRTGEVVLNK